MIIYLILQLLADDSPYLDDNNDLSLRISIYLLNVVCEHDTRVVVLDISDAAHVFEDLHRSMTPSTHLVSTGEIHQQEENDGENKDNVDDKDLMIASLTDHLNSSYDYINKLERNPKKV